MSVPGPGICPGVHCLQFGAPGQLISMQLPSRSPGAFTPTIFASVGAIAVVSIGRIRVRSFASRHQKMIGSGDRGRSDP
jgi:hypothetical protein